MKLLQHLEKWYNFRTKNQECFHVLPPLPPLPLPLPPLLPPLPLPLPRRHPRHPRRRRRRRHLLPW